MGREEKKHILVFSPLYVADHCDKEQPLCAELRQRGHKVVHVFFSARLKKKYPANAFPEDIFTLNPELTQSLAIDSLKQLYDLMDNAKIFISGGVKGPKEIYSYAKSLRLPMLYIDDDPVLDFYYHGEDFLTAADPFRKDFILKRAPVAEDRVRVTGHPQYDRVHQRSVTSMTKEEFCRQHGLDASQKLAVFCPTKGVTEYTARLYPEICSIVDGCDGFALIIKPHPRDWVKCKKGNIIGYQHTWEVLYPQATICKQGLGYQCFNVCDVGISIRSSIAMEFPLFKKPFIYVGAEEFPNKPAYWIDSKTPYEFVGMNCKINELQSVLLEGKYRNIDPEAYEHFCRKYYSHSDGRVHVKIADWVEEILKREQKSGRSNPLRRIKQKIRQLVG